MPAQGFAAARHAPWRITLRLLWPQLHGHSGAGAAIFAAAPGVGRLSLIHSLNAGCEFQINKSHLQSRGSHDRVRVRCVEFDQRPDTLNCLARWRPVANAWFIRPSSARMTACASAGSSASCWPLRSLPPARRSRWSPRAWAPPSPWLPSSPPSVFAGSPPCWWRRRARWRWPAQVALGAGGLALAGVIAAAGGLASPVALLALALPFEAWWIGGSRRAALWGGVSALAAVLLQPFVGSVVAARCARRSRRGTGCCRWPGR